MKDLLQISGLLDLSYWMSFEIAGMALSQILIWYCVPLLAVGKVLSWYHLLPYVALMSFYAMNVMAFLMAFGFVVFKSEYYGLPAFILTVALCVGGDYVANDYNISIGLKCMYSTVSFILIAKFNPPIVSICSVFGSYLSSYQLFFGCFHH
jgi:hypothetical protein